jgi:hypothetical protein
MRRFAPDARCRGGGGLEGVTVAGGMRALASIVCTGAKVSVADTLKPGSPLQRVCARLTVLPFC